MCGRVLRRGVTRRAFAAVQQRQRHAEALHICVHRPHANICIYVHRHSPGRHHGGVALWQKLGLALEARGPSDAASWIGSAFEGRRVDGQRAGL